MSTAARLRALVTVADAGSVRAAARRLSVTESAVSAALAALARETRVPLVERDGRGLRLTGAGRGLRRLRAADPRPARGGPGRRPRRARP